MTCHVNVKQHWEPDRYLSWDGNRRWGLEKKQTKKGSVLFQEGAPVAQFQPVVTRLKHGSLGHSFSDFLGIARNLDDHVKFAGSIMSAIY